MYPSRFRYEAPASLEEAISLLQEGNGQAKVLAGGQSLIPMLKLRFAAPEMLVDINNIPGLDHLVADPDGTIRIGALCRHEHIERSALIAEHQPTVAAAAPLIADPIVRTRGTFVGSVCHADPQGDWAACMIALDGSIVAEGPDGRRTIPVRDFVRGPFTNVLAPDEIAVEAVIPPPRGRAHGGYLKLERRIGDFATAAVAVAVDLDGRQVGRAGIGLVGVGGRTIDAREAAEALVGGPLNAEVIANAADLAAGAAQPRSDHRGSASYKRHIVRTFTARILSQIDRSLQEAA
ncbi:FAD binding domain-containing protein [Nitriliruptor alkaliphilus]|uniref:FAD binding domain-containing protein n=1 Tax=Nitriliruptor alkaliphilus TaxID=427918 RepID=UPI0006983DAD|nr:xanthine dehydrogenase family protein subunit M [Nitriliruptor alkaliphilus]